MDKAIFVLAEHYEGEVEEASVEVLCEARRLADKAKSTVHGIILGHGIGHLADVLGRYGADHVSWVDHPLLEHYSTEGYTLVLSDLLHRYQAGILLLAATALGRDLAPRIAIRLHTGLISNCTTLRFNEEGFLEARRPTYGGRVWAIHHYPSGRPLIATIRPGVLGVSTPRMGREFKAEKVEVQLRQDQIRSKVVRCYSVDKESLDISEAEVVVAIGRGIKDVTWLPKVKELSGLLNASYGGSRAAVDEGWIPFSRQIGQTGKSVTPKLIVCLGISGAPQFTLGMRDAKYIVAVNNDREAPIFKVADLAVLCDLREVVPALIGLLKGRLQRCGGSRQREEQGTHEP